GLCAAAFDEGADGIGVIAFVGDQPVELACRLDQRCRHGHVIDIAGGDQQHAWPALCVGQSMELAGPPAERCALMWVASIATLPHTPQWPVSASNISNQMPWRLHRLKRL